MSAQAGARARIDAVLFALGLLIAGPVLLALAWSTTAPYADLARANGYANGAVLVDQAGGGSTTVDLATLVEYHRRWSAYVTGGTEAPPTSAAAFTDDEVSHMADVRRVFDGAKLLVPAGLFLCAYRLQRARRESLAAMLLLARDGAMLAAAALALLGIGAALAFDAFFLAFHYVFFPQGNFFFPPSSNLIRLYPGWYWEGITLRIGASFLLGCALVVGLSAFGLQRVRSTRLASA